MTGGGWREGALRPGRRARASPERSPKAVGRAQGEARAVGSGRKRRSFVCKGQRVARELRRKWRLPGEAIPQRCARGQRAATRPRLREPPAACPCCREAPQLLLAGGSRRLFSVRAGDDLPLLSLLNTSCSGSSGSRGAAALSEGLNVLSKIWRLHERRN